LDKVYFIFIQRLSQQKSNAHIEIENRN